MERKPILLYIAIVLVLAHVRKWKSAGQVVVHGVVRGAIRKGPPN